MKTTFTTASKMFYHLARIGLGITFIWASWDKILHPAAFAAIVENYAILPTAAVNLAALVLPWIEMTCGLFLLSGRLVPGAAFTLDLLLFIFIAATALNLYRGLDINCGCFSVSPEARSHAVLNLLRNSFMLAAGIWLLLAGSTRSGRGRYARGTG